MEHNPCFTEADYDRRMSIINVLLPHYGRSTDELLEAATLVEGYLKGLPPVRPSGTADKE